MGVECEVAHSQPSLAPVLTRVFAPQDASAVLVSGEGGTGKTFGAVSLMPFLTEQLGVYSLTNIPFARRVKTENGWVKVNPHERVRVVSSMRDLWYQYALIKKEDPFAVTVVSLDEWHKWVDRMKSYEDLATNFKDWWGENRKFRTVPECITQKMSNIPRRLLKYIKWYIAKSKALTDEYNGRWRTSFDVKDLMFVISITPEDDLEHKDEVDFGLERVDEVLLTERGRWTGDPNTVRAGEVVYQSEASSTFRMGEVRGSEDWFEEFLHHISGALPMELGGRMLEFFEEDPTRDIELESQPLSALAMHVYRRHVADLVPAEGEHPVIKLSTVRGRKLVPVELNPTNLSRIFRCSQQTLSRRFEKLV